MLNRLINLTLLKNILLKTAIAVIGLQQNHLFIWTKMLKKEPQELIDSYGSSFLLTIFLFHHSFGL
ncbi:hypothetical protein BC781_102635 [Sediminitomix flava]|uniref:Uncharacterized protein n=1 Tax=Sediminitomix flava TaxID=379075 RepID=A0A316A0B4_SEDFL|nr:hypothetical protein BC781_102635 [Sediminitomix flava]